MSTVVSKAATVSSACFFRLNAQLFAVEGAYMQQVVTVPNLTRVPRTAKSLLGVFAVRGSVLPLIDLGPLLALEDGSTAADLAALITYEERFLALKIDGVVGFSPLERSAMMPLQNAPQEVQHYGLGEVTRSGEKVTILNVPTLFKALETQLEVR